jgi:hypothetical protein
LATVYGESELNGAVTELLALSIVGVDQLERVLKASRTDAKNELLPKPIIFQNQKLNRVVPNIDLRKYDAILFENRNKHQNELNLEGKTND